MKPLDQAAVKRVRRAKRVDEAVVRLRREVERQDAAGYRDWAGLVEAVVDCDVYDLNDFNAPVRRAKAA